MTGYREIADVEVEQGRIATSQTAVALRDNPKAIAEGAPTAPRIDIHALVALTVGDVVRFDLPDTVTTQSGSYVQAFAITLAQRGACRVKWEHSRFSGSQGSNSSTRVLLNGVQVGDVTAAGGSWAARAQDVTGIAAGDVISIEHRIGNVADTSGVRNVQICTGGVNIWPCSRGYVFSDAPE
jgi:hypothetical protein